MSREPIAKPTLNWVDRGSGVPIVWLHGFPFSGRIWSDQLTIPGFRHVAPDFPGFGISPPPELDMSIDGYARSILSLLDYLAVGQAVLAGLSMGGYVAMALLRIAPERFARLILVDTRSAADSSEGRRKRLEAIAEVSANGIGGLVRKMLPDLLFNGNPRDIRRVREIMEESSPAGVINALRAMAERPDSAKTLSSLRMPVLVAVGSQDAITPPQDAEDMASMIPSCCLVKIDGAGHLSNVQQPEIFNSQVATFASREAFRK